MGYIEKYWDDIIVYYVEFTVQTDLYSRRKHKKILVFHSHISKKDVSHLVFTYFNNIAEVLHVDEVTEGLLLKQ